MSKWKKWQRSLFLGYLLLLNVIVFSTLTYALLKKQTEQAAQSTPEVLVDLPAFLLKKSKPRIFKLSRDKPAAISAPPTLLPALSPTNLAHHRSTPSINDSLNTSLNQSTKEPSSSAIKIPQPTKTFTVTPQPTVTHTPQPTATTTPTTTYSPKPTATSTASPTLQPATLTPTATNIPTKIFIPSPSPMATKINSISAVASAFKVLLAANKTDISPDRLAKPDSAPIGKIEASIIDNDILLDWSGVDGASDYEVYSDMGRGYGVYIHRTQVKMTTYLDKYLHPGLNYSYLVTYSEKEIEIPIAETTTILKNLSQENALFLTSSFSENNLTPVPTALPADVVLLGLVSDNNFTDNFNMLTIAGEIRNDSSLTVGAGEITVTFYNQAGAVVETTQGKTMLEAISAGETSPFLITIPRPVGMASYSLRAVARPAAARLTPQLSVEETRRFEDNIGFFHIKGAIQNVGQTTAKQVKVAAIIYGRDGRVININFTYVDPPNLRPGQSASYDVRFTYYPRYITQAVIPFEE